jgi:hypothetical protein
MTNEIMPRLEGLTIAIRHLETYHIARAMSPVLDEEDLADQYVTATLMDLLIRYSGCQPSSILSWSSYKAG